MLHQKMFYVTSLPVKAMGFWSWTTLSEPAIMVCTNVLVLKSKHSESGYFLISPLSISHSLLNSEVFFSGLFFLLLSLPPSLSLPLFPRLVSPRMVPVVRKEKRIEPNRL